MGSPMGVTSNIESACSGARAASIPETSRFVLVPMSVHVPPKIAA